MEEELINEDEEEELEAEEQPVPDLPLVTKAGVFLGAAGLVSVADLVAHWGVPGLAIGGFLAFALTKTSPQLYAAFKKQCPELPAAVQQRQARPRTRWEQRSNTHEQVPTRPTDVPTRDQSIPDELPRPHDDLPVGEVPQHTTIDIPTGTTLFTFTQVLKRFTPSLDRLFLGVLPDGTPIFCAAKDLCHVALAGTTGGGKSSILRLLLAQLCYAGACVLLLNPHYTHCDIEADPAEDWTPFERYLLHDPLACRAYEVIEFYLKHVACDLLPRRLEQYAHSQPLGKPYFLAIEELPAIVANVKHAPEYLATILREGRKVGIYLITVAQDFLVKTIAPGGGGGAVRDCYRTAYYVGGDGTTAKVLLDVPMSLLPEQELGQGTVLLRSSRVPLVKQACLVRVPYVDNPALYRLLGPSTYAPTPAGMPWQPTEAMTLETLRPTASVMQAPTQAAPVQQAAKDAPQGPGSLHAVVAGRLDQIARMYQPGMTAVQLARALGISEQKASTLLREARARGLIRTGMARARQHREPLQVVKAQAEEQAPLLPASYQKAEPRIPTIQEVIAAFPEKKPSKREIQKHFGITDHQAYKLYQQL